MSPIWILYVRDDPWPLVFASRGIVKAGGLSLSRILFCDEMGGTGDVVQGEHYQAQRFFGYSQRRRC